MLANRKLLPLLSTLLIPVGHAATWSPHVGIDYKYWGLEPNVYYEDIFPRVNNTLKIYAGTRINGYFGVDIGYEETENRHQTEVFIGDGTEAPFAEIELPGNSSMVDIRLKALTMDFNFYWEVVPRFEIIFMAGIAFVNPSTHINHLADGIWYEYREDVETKTMGRIGIGAQFNPIPCLGIKALISWDPDMRLNYVGFDQNDVEFDIHPYHTSASFSIGFVYSFSNPRRMAPTPIPDF